MLLFRSEKTAFLLRYPKVFALGSALFVFLGLWALHNNERTLSLQRQRIEVIEKLTVLHAKLSSSLTSTIAAARVLAVSLATHPDLSKEEFVILANEVMAANLSIRNLVLVRDTIANYVYPLEGNEKILGVNYRNLPEQWPVYQRMMQERSIQVAGPLNLVQGGTGLVVRIPVYKPGDPSQFLGSIAMVVQYDTLMSEIGMDSTQNELNIAIRGRDGAGMQGEVFYGSPALFDGNPVLQDVVLPGGRWVLAAEPMGRWQGSTRVTRIIEIFGAILMLLVASLSYQWIVRNRLRLQNEKELVQSQRLLQARDEALSVTSQGVLIADFDTHVSYVNQAGCFLTGLSQSELLGMQLDALFGAPLSAQKLQQQGTHSTLLHEISRERADGRLIWLELSLTTVLDFSNSPRQFVLLLRDITEKKHTENELQIAAMAFETQEGILIMDADKTILRVNRAFSKITGFEPAAAIGQPFAILQSGRHDPAFYEEMWRTINTLHFWQGEIWNRRQNGEEYAERLVISAVRAADGSISNYVSSFMDVTEQKNAEEKIHQLAFYDPLTNLPNRRLLMDRLGRAMAATKRHLRYGAVLMIDLDNFKTLNDTQGHNVGDQLLVQIGRRIGACTRTEDTVSRTGGDEFVVVMEGLHLEAGQAAILAEVVAEKIRQVLCQLIPLEHLVYESSGSIGVTLFCNENISIDELLKRADMAMYQAKALGKNSIRFFDPSMQAALESRTTLENDLRAALANNQFELHYQLQVSALGDPIGAETLLRWRHPGRGMVSPLDFIALAEETGLILPIGLWVLESACRQLKKWDSDARCNGMQLAVNVSARQFHQANFFDEVKRIVQETGANPVLLKLELTESVVLEHVDAVIEKMHKINELGIHFSMDDFGTGYSSLSYLQRLPLQQLKIDRSFVHNQMFDGSNANIVRTIIALGSSLGLNVIAEGVETAEQRDFLLNAGCLAYQGYFFGKPVPIAQFESQLSHSAQ